MSTRIGAVCVVVGIALVAAACNSSPSPAAKTTGLFNSGIAAQKAGNYSLAASDFRQVVAASPNNVSALYDLGLVEQLQNQLTAAETFYGEVISIDPKFVNAIFNLAICVTPSNPTEAEGLYKQVLTLSPSNADAWLNLGYVLRTLHRVKAGNADIVKAVKLDPSLASHAPRGLKT